MTTPIEKILPREVLRDIKPRPAHHRIADAEHARDLAKAEKLILERALREMTAERDMLARRLADLSHKHTDARVLLGMCMTTLKSYREHIDARKLHNRLRGYFDLPEDAT